MKTIDIDVFRNNVGDFIAFANSGEVIRILVGDTIVAELRPPPIDVGKLSQDEILREWQRRGVMTPAVNPGGVPLKGAPVMSFEELMKGLAEDREDR